MTVLDPDPARHSRLAGVAGAALAATHFLLTWTLRLGLPLICTGGLLRVFPYKGRAAGVAFQVQATLFTRTGISVDTSLGSWRFPHVDGLPVGFHLAPEDVNLLRVGRSASRGTGAFVDGLKSSFMHQLPALATWLLVTCLIGTGLGLAVAAALNMALRYLRGLPRRPRELAIRARQLAAAGVVFLAVIGIGIVSFDRSWTEQSSLTGTLGAAQLFPSELQRYYNRRTKVYDVLGSVIGIQATLQDRIDRSNRPDTAFNIMFVSDLHLAAVYPLISQYAQSFDVSLIINTGDESEFGTAAEMTPAYLAAVAAVTSRIPMIWVAGNHDSPQTETVMDAVPGVTVLGAKVRRPDGSYTVSASQLNAFGLSVGAVPDPRVYGADSPFGAGDDATTNPLEKTAMDRIAASAPDATFDILATHEPSAAGELAKKFGDRVRQLNSGHAHAENRTSDIQHGSQLSLVEGSTGAGGLDQISRGSQVTPIEFSIEAVSGGCQFVKLLRFQIADPAVQSDPNSTALRNDVTTATVYPRLQSIPSGRRCDPALGLTAPVPLGSGD